MSFWHRSDFLWVYGTLRRGESNHHQLQGRARFVEIATLPGHLFSVEGRHPVLQLDPEGPPVVGELYSPLVEARAALFADLDRLEGLDDEDYVPVVVEQAGYSWSLYAVGARLSSYCRGECRIASGDWCRYRADDTLSL